MRTICAWCGRILADGDGELISHGICKECKQNELNSIILKTEQLKNNVKSEVLEKTNNLESLK